MIHSNSKTIAIIITAAGSSTRMGGCVKKEYLPLKNETVLSYCTKNLVKTFNITKSEFKINKIIITIPKNGKNEAESALKPFFLDNQMYAKKIDFVEGGTSRQKSIKNAMEYLNQNTKEIDYVLIHDGARPFINEQIIENLLENIEEYGAVAPGITPTDTIKEIDDKNLISKHLKRTNLIAIQTPQFFDFKKLLEAHEKASLKDYEYTDDTEIWGDFCGQVKIVNGDFKNIKITYPGDLERGANFD